MSRWSRVAFWAVAFAIGAGAGVFLIRQGLSQAGLWATALGLPLAAVGTAAGVWSTMLASRALRESRQNNVHSEGRDQESPHAATYKKDALVEIVDPSIDRKLDTMSAGSGCLR